MKTSSLLIQTPVRSNSLLRLMQSHVLSFFFILALGLTWVYELIILGLLHLPAVPWGIPAPLVGPTFSAFFMTALVEGRAGLIGMLHRCMLWRVPIRWYLFTFLGIPAVIFFNILILPGAIAALRAPAAPFLVSYLVIYVVIFLVGGPLLEEPGWRGFALPRLQARYGPLVGTLILGTIWSLWHWPLFLLVPGYDGAGSGFAGIGIPFLVFVVSTTAMAFVLTWVFNHTQGSLLLAMLLHASSNTANTQLPALFPSLPASLWQYAAPVVVALLIIVTTRGRLGYDHDRPEVAAPMSGLGAERVAVPRRKG